ncbi:hypothetical protein ACFYY8_28830 [Streptosporangium sp. NPDC001559]|uniref:hypothetical protein n=1 Tax=Streptosporangium sp. NPDC001559 TaxID=3366187 RepID=UPI0036E14E68
MTSGVARQSCDAVQRAHSDWLVFHNSATGLWSAYRRVPPGRPGPGDTPLVRAGSAEELDRKLTAQASPVVPPSIRAVAIARALQAARISRVVQAVCPGQVVVPGLRRLLRS